MQAVVFAGTREVAVQDVPDADLEEPTDERAGPAVEMVKPGDRVVIPTHLYCGVCVNCARGLSAACLRVRPGGFGAAYGYAGSWHASVLAQMYPGASVAVFGAGTIGLLSAYSCQLKGAAEVYIVDYIPERLSLAGELGFTPVDFRRGDPVGQAVLNPQAG